MSAFDEPVLIREKRRWSAKHLLITGLVLVFVGGILAIPVYQRNVETRARTAPRGPNAGTLYPIDLKGTTYTLELGWIAPAFSARLTPPPPSETTLEVNGIFGRDTLTWNADRSCFGPSKTQINPYQHYKVDLTLRHGTDILWHDTLWAYGVKTDR